MQLTVAQNGHKVLRRSTSSASVRRVFLSPAVMTFLCPGTTSPAAAATVAGAGVKDSGTSGSSSGSNVNSSKFSGAQCVQLRDSAARVCDSVYESCLDACSLLLNGAQDTSVVRAALGVIAEVFCGVVFAFSL